MSQYNDFNKLPPPVFSTFRECLTDAEMLPLATGSVSKLFIVKQSDGNGGKQTAYNWDGETLTPFSIGTAGVPETPTFTDIRNPAKLLTSTNGAKKIVSNLIDTYTGELFSLTKINTVPVIDNIIYFNIDGENFERNTESDFINAKWFGAKGDNINNDTAALQAAIDACRALNKGTVYIPQGIYISGALSVPDSVILRGDGRLLSLITFSGSGYAVHFGGNSANLSFGCGAKDIGIVLSHIDGKGLLLEGTCGAILIDVYIEGMPIAVKNNIGVTIDGSNASSYFNRLENVRCNHVQKGFVLAGTPIVSTTTNFINCQAFGDTNLFPANGSIGIEVLAEQGNGAMWAGGNFESCDYGIMCRANAHPMAFTGVRFEANGTDIHIEALSKKQSFIGCIWLTTIVQGNGYNEFTACTDSSNRGFTQTGFVGVGMDRPAAFEGIALAIDGNIRIKGNPGASRFILLDENNTGTTQLGMQAGSGSSAYGGGISMYGNAHATLAGWVKACLSANAAAKFSVNSEGIGTGAELFTVDRSGNVVITGSLALPATITAAGVLGPQVINKISGSFNITAGTNTEYVNNNKVTINSIVLAVVRSDDATAVIKNCLSYAGFFVVNLTANATANTKIGFIVIN